MVRLRDKCLKAHSFIHLQGAEHIVEELERAGKHQQLQGYEMVKAVHVTLEDWNEANDLMTPSMKVSCSWTRCLAVCLDTGPQQMTFTLPMCWLPTRFNRRICSDLHMGC